MAIDIKFDLNGNPEPPTIILANRNGNKLGQLDVDQDSIDLNDKLVDACEFTFTLHKYINNKITNLWDKMVSFKLIYCKEWDEWFEASVELDEETETIKTVLCTQLEKSELSQLNLYNVEINTEDDIARDDYKITILYNEEDKEASLLDRLLKDKAPHYSISHVDSTIANIQRSFSFDDKSIYDAFQEIAEEIGCLFIFHSYIDENKKLRRTISVYDLQQNCNDCGYRGEYTGKCPKCDSKNIKNGYGEDTLIFITSDELASNGIKLESDEESVKNCFKLEAGDDLMTATIRNCNPNGSDYIWRFSNDTKEDMSSELVEKLESYDEVYKEYYNDYVSDIDHDLLNNYNNIIDKYSIYNKNLQRIITPIKGYSSLMNAYYNVVDLSLYLKSGLMPSIEMSDTSALEQANLLTSESLSPVAVTDVTIASLSTMNSAVLAMAKIIVRSSYKVEVNTSEIVEGGNGRSWRGNFIVTNYSDEEDTATSNVISISINDDLETYIKQKIDKTLNKENTDDLSISGLFKKEYNDFCNELKKYALNPLNNFYDACQACIDILIEQGVGTNNTWASTDEGSESNLYENLYIPYYDKLMAIEYEMNVRESEINIVSGAYDLDGNLIIKGLRTNIEEYKNNIQNVLDFKKYLGNELWLELCSYRRDDKYSNENYISDGLNNAELFKRALEFFEIAENEIYKSSELQHSISTTLNNLLAIPKFKSFVSKFKVGNWIRVRIDEKIYRLRLLEYGIDFGGFDEISVEFSDVTKIKNGITDVQNVLSKASSMASSYDAVQRQANQGEKSNNILNNWIEKGLNTTNTKIINTDNQTQMWGKNGFLCREYDPIKDCYSDEQLKIINSTVAITDDNWETTKTAIGKYYYVDPNTNELKTTYGINGETIVGKLLIGQQLDISNDNGSLDFGENGLVVKNDINTVIINPNDESIFNIKNNSNNIFSFNEKGELVIVGNITATNLTLIDGTTIDTGNITGLSDVAVSGDYDDLKNKPNLSTVAISGSYNDLLNKPSLATVATSGSYNDLKNKPTNISSFNNDANYVTRDEMNEAINIATPVRGVDYWTEADKQEIINAVLAELQA